MSLALKNKNLIQWMVYRDGQIAAGPVTSYEIRIALRQGTLKLNDYAGQKNSILRFPIMDIDELFQDVVPTKKNNPLINLNDTRTNHPKHTNDAQNQVLKLVKPSDINPPKYGIPKNVEIKKSLEKIYYLKDRKGRKLGPMDEDEILLFAAKIKKLKNVKVLKHQSNQVLPLEKFIAMKHHEKASIQKKKHHAFHPLTLLNEGLPSSRVIEELANFEALRSLSKSRENNFTLIAGITLLIFLILILLWQLKILHIDLPFLAESKTFNSSSIESKNQTPPLSTNQIPIIQSNQAPADKPPVPTPVETKQNERREISKRKSQNIRPERSPRDGFKSSDTSRVPIINAIPKAVVTSAPTTPPKLEKPLTPARNLQNPPTPTKRSGLKINEMLRYSGEVVDTSALSFNPSQLQKCPNKCMLDVKDENGDQAKLIFFKAAYGNALLQSKGKTKVKARVSDGLTGLDLYLESLNSP